MDSSAVKRTRRFIANRQQNPAWLLLASPRAPLVLGCLSSLFELSDDGIAEEDALQALANMLASYANQDEYDIDPDHTLLQAGRELRQWIKRGLVIERGQRVYATDALSSAIAFVESLDDRIMTTTASRLSVVQREIENLEVGLNPNPEIRISSIRRKITQLENELADVNAGKIEVLSEAQAIESIREIFSLASGLRSDFRRVEDSWRDADRQLRQSVMSDQYHRGDIVDRLLEGQQALLNTPEGRVFDSFQQQLRRGVELDEMRERLRNILSHPAADKALKREQLVDLKWLSLRLVKESQSVLQARSRSEKDVKSFLKTGLANEHHRVGQLLNEIMQTAMELDWSQQKVRRSEVGLPPTGVAMGQLPVPERLRFTSLTDSDSPELDLSIQESDLSGLDDEFWRALDGLDREAMLQDTLQLLKQQNKPLSMAELCQHLPPQYDLETLTLWLEMAAEAGIDIQGDNPEYIELSDSEQRRWQYTVPYVALDGELLHDIDWEL